MSAPEAQVCVVGGGLSGLAAAYALDKAGIPALVLEAGDRLGGRVKTVPLHGCAFDVGAIGLLGTYKQTVALIDELGLSPRLSSSAVCLGVPRQGRLNVLDMARPMSILRTPLLSGADFWSARKLVTPLIRHWSRLNFDSIAGMQGWDAESVEAFGRRELTLDLYEYLIGPIIRALWQRDPEEAPLIDLFWSLKAFAPKMYALKGGMQHLSDALAARVQGLVGAKVLAVEDAPDGAHVSYRLGGETRSHAFRGCVLAVPPSIASGLLRPLSAPLQNAFAELPYSCSVNVHFALAKPIGGPLQLVFPPHSEAPDLTTVVFEHNKGPGRAPAGKGAMSLFWRDGWSRPRRDADEAAIVRDAIGQARRVVPEFSESQVEAAHVERWDFAGVARRVGASAAVAQIEAEATRLRHVTLAGDYFALSGMNAAVVSGQRAARQLAARVRGGSASLT